MVEQLAVKVAAPDRNVGMQTGWIVLRDSHMNSCKSPSFRTGKPTFLDVVTSGDTVIRSQACRVFSWYVLKWSSSKIARLGRFRDYPIFGSRARVTYWCVFEAPRTLAFFFDIVEKVFDAGEEIVHALRKLRGTCNQLVVGSNPTRRAIFRLRYRIAGLIAFN